MEHTSTLRPKFGLSGFVIGIVSLLIMMVQLSAILAPEPAGPTAGEVIGEIAADIKSSAARALSGEPSPAKPPPPPDYGPYFTTFAMCLAAVAMVLGGIALYRGEPHRLAYMAVGFGVSAFVMQYVFWLAVMVCAVVLLVSIIGNLDSIVGS